MTRCRTRPARSPACSRRLAGPAATSRIFRKSWSTWVALGTPRAPSGGSSIGPLRHNATSWRPTRSGLLPAISLASSLDRVAKSVWSTIVAHLVGGVAECDQCLGAGLARGCGDRPLDVDAEIEIARHDLDGGGLSSSAAAARRGGGRESDGNDEGDRGNGGDELLHDEQLSIRGCGTGRATATRRGLPGGWLVPEATWWAPVRKPPIWRHCRELRSVRPADDSDERLDVRILVVDQPGEADLGLGNAA